MVEGLVRIVIFFVFNEEVPIEAFVLLRLLRLRGSPTVVTHDSNTPAAAKHLPPDVSLLGGFGEDIPDSERHRPCSLNRNAIAGPRFGHRTVDEGMGEDTVDECGREGCGFAAFVARYVGDEALEVRWDPERYV